MYVYCFAFEEAREKRENVMLCYVCVCVVFECKVLEVFCIRGDFSRTVSFRSSFHRIEVEEILVRLDEG